MTQQASPVDKSTQFKKGDKLSVIENDTHGFLDKKKIYTFQGYDREGWIRVEEHGYGGFYPTRFQLAKEVLFDNLYKRMTQ